MANIWCANGETAEICENYSTFDGKTSADVPAALASNPQSPNFFRAELTDPSRKSPFYTIMNLLVTKNTSQSVLLIRVFNSLISSLIFFALLFFGTKKARVAVVSAWTFTITPVIIATLWQPNPRSWGYLSVMSSCTQGTYKNRCTKQAPTRLLWKISPTRPPFLYMDLYRIFPMPHETDPLKQRSTQQQAEPQSVKVDFSSL
jgi:hypothetical protein